VAILEIFSNVFFSFKNLAKIWQKFGKKIAKQWQNLAILTRKQFHIT
jgi:hypothetical protein